MNLQKLLSNGIRKAAQSLGVDVAVSQLTRALDVTKSDRPDLADYQCNAAMGLAKILKKQPREIATAFSERLSEDMKGIATISIAGPGFINFKIQDEYLLKHASAHLFSLPVLERSTPPRSVVLDFGGPNIAKELHVGHLRPHLIGDSLQRIMRAAGDHVVSDIHMGDWGTPMGMIITQLQREEPNLPYFNPKLTSYPTQSPVSIQDLGALYRRSKQSWDSDPSFQNQARKTTEELQAGSQPGYRALWQHFRDISLKDVRRMYDKLGVHFDLWLGESDVNEILPGIMTDLTKRGIAEKSQGALVISAEKIGLPAESPPVILQKSDGGYTYAATDIATIKDRVENKGADAILYVVDNRQRQHFEMVFAAARLAGYAPPHVLLEHVGHGTINGPDGKPFKTRDGNTAKLSDILDLADKKAFDELPIPGEQGVSAEEITGMAQKIGVAALKFQELRNNRATDYIFNADEFTRYEGKTGPYLQYAFVRAAAILEKAHSTEQAPGEIRITHPAERDLIMYMSRMPEVLEAAYTAREPSIMAEHAYGMVQKFGTFYASVPVLQESDSSVRASRIGLVKAFSIQLGGALSLLNIQSPERMLRRSLENAPEQSSTQKKPEGNSFKPRNSFRPI